MYTGGNNFPKRAEARNGWAAAKQAETRLLLGFAARELIVHGTRRTEEGQRAGKIFIIASNLCGEGGVWVFKIQVGELSLYVPTYGICSEVQCSKRASCPITKAISELVR